MSEEMTIEKAREIAQDLRPERNAIDGILARGFIAAWDQQEDRLKTAREALKFIQEELKANAIDIPGYETIEEALRRIG